MGNQLGFRGQVVIGFYPAPPAERNKPIEILRVMCYFDQVLISWVTSKGAAIAPIIVNQRVKGG
jgi:hypothetical protein